MLNDLIVLLLLMMLSRYFVVILEIIPVGRGLVQIRGSHTGFYLAMGEGKVYTTVCIDLCTAVPILPSPAVFPCRGRSGDSCTQASVY